MKNLIDKVAARICPSWDRIEHEDGHAAFRTVAKGVMFTVIVTFEMTADNKRAAQFAVRSGPDQLLDDVHLYKADLIGMTLGMLWALGETRRCKAINSDRVAEEYVLNLEGDIAARDRTIAEQAEALEGYRAAMSCGVPDAEMPVVCIDDQAYRSWVEEVLLAHLPAHEIAALRERGVEVGE